MLHEEKVHAVDITSASGNFVLPFVSWFSEGKFESLRAVNAQREGPSRFINKFDWLNQILCQVCLRRDAFIDSTWGQVLASARRSVSNSNLFLFGLPIGLVKEDRLLLVDCHLVRRYVRFELF